MDFQGLCIGSMRVVITTQHDSKNERMINMKATKLVNELLNLRESNSNLQDMAIWLSKDRRKVTVNLEYTGYDYDFIPKALEDIIDQYMYEWNYSWELEVYL